MKLLGVEAATNRVYPRQIPVTDASIARRGENPRKNRPRIITNIEKKRRTRGKRNRAPMADAMTAVRDYRNALGRDLMQADASWERIDDPYRSDMEDPLRGRSARAVECARKGKEFIAIAKKFGTSKAAQILRSDARRVGGALIRRNEAAEEFDRAISEAVRRLG